MSLASLGGGSAVANTFTRFGGEMASNPLHAYLEPRQYIAFGL